MLLIHSVGSALFIFLGSVWGWSTPNEEHFTGVLYSNHGGPSGKGSGEIRLRTGSRVYEIWYQKPIEAEFAGSVCYEMGAIWDVVVRAELGRRVLQKAKCDGKVDRAIHSAWMTVRLYLDCRMGNPGASCAEYFSSHRRRSKSLVKQLSQLADMDLAEYRKFGGRGLCLAVGEAAGRSVAISAGIDCSIRWRGEPADVIFWTVGIPGTSFALIDKLELTVRQPIERRVNGSDAEGKR